MGRSPCPRMVFHPEREWLLWDSCPPLIFGFKKALVPVYPDERGPFRGSKTAEVPLITLLLRVLGGLRNKHQGVPYIVRGNSWPPRNRPGR